LSTDTGVVLWFTGLPSAGKSTLAHAVGAIVQAARPVEILDGDEVRTHLSKGLGFSRADRDTNVLRIGFVARLLARHGVFVITAAISPYAAARDEVRRDAEADGVSFVEVFVSAGLETVVARDVKGLYRRALAGEIPGFTGVSDPYEAPVHPEIVVHTDRESVDESVGTIVRALVARGLLPSAAIG
jgi:adenylyl-sulfate kinase